MLAHLSYHLQKLASKTEAAGPKSFKKIVGCQTKLPKPGDPSRDLPVVGCSSRGPCALGGPPPHFLCPFSTSRARLPRGPAAPMDPLNLSWYDDDLESQNWSRPFNGSEGKAGRPQYNYYATLLTLLIFIIVFGNVLVCMAVSREKALQTTTNYLIVSLAVADLLVATLVMPWVVYLEVGLGPACLPPLSKGTLGSSPGCSLASTHRLPGALSGGHVLHPGLSFLLIKWAQCLFNNSNCQC